MADKSFGVKDINLIGASGTPEIESPNNLNINAVNVAISTDMSVGGALTVAGDLTVNGTTTTIDTAVTSVDSLSVDGNITAVGRVFSNQWFQSDRTDGTNSAFYATVSGTEKLNIRANGSASFAAGAFAIESDGDISTNVRCHGHIELDSTGSFTSPKIKLFANTGGAEFNGLTTVKSDFFGSPVGNAAGITLTGADSTSATAFRVMPGSFPSTESINFSWTGSSLFKGVCVVDRSVSGDGCFHARLNGATKASITSSGNATFGSYNDSSASGYGVKINILANSGDVRSQCQSTASQYTQMYGGYFGSSRTFHVLANGNVQNTNNSYSQISDVKLKENIVDANSQWDDLKSVQVRNFNFKAETGHSTHTQIGVVAQEIESVSPGLVYETPDQNNEGEDLGTVTKAVNYSVLYMKSVKALQEAMTRIETLEAKVAALEG